MTVTDSSRVYVHQNGRQPLTEAEHELMPVLVPYPANPVLKALLKGPVLMWKLGLGPIVGKSLMIMTTRGRKSGLPRHTPIEYHEVRGRKYVYDAHGPKADWYKNIQADPHITIQTASGTERVIARRVADDEELRAAYSFLSHNPVMKRWTEALGVEVTEEQFLAYRDRFFVVTFDPTEENTPPPVDADLSWIWGVVLAAALGGLLFSKRRKEKHHRATQ